MKDKKVYNSILETIGETPLIRLNRIVEDLNGTFYAKWEGANPGNSAKDRIAKYIIEKAEREGVLKPGATIVETTSGNTGFSLSMVAIVRGYKCIVAVSDKTKLDKIAYLKAMGAEVHMCPASVPADHPDSYYSTAKRIHEETPNSIYINQYFNTNNTDAHYQTTGREIWEQTEGKITHLVACAGTGGTISGAARYLKEQNPDIKVLAVDAFGSVLKKYHETGELDKNEIFPYRIGGLGKNLIPGSLDFNVIDHFEKVTDKEAALRARETTQKEGILVGYTTGAAVQALHQLEHHFNKDSFVVVIFPDHGSRYMEKIYNDDWMRKEGFFEAEVKVNGNKLEKVNA
ncbi:MAG: cystathionine beta-synthase [Saprospiraceae bacterium]|jgi:cystathionine beta-synthase